MKKKSKKIWQNGLVLVAVVIIWYLLLRGGYHLLPGAKKLSEVMPMWIIILNLVLLLFLIVLLIDERNWHPRKLLVIFIGLPLSSILTRIGYERFPLITIIGTVMIALVVFILKGCIDNKGGKKKSKKNKS